MNTNNTGTWIVTYYCDGDLSTKKDSFYGTAQEVYNEVSTYAEVIGMIWRKIQ